MMSCIACQGTGVGDGQGEAPQGQLLPLCRACKGSGQVLPAVMPAAEPYVAIWLVGRHYVVRMTVPRRRGVVELDLEWAPRMPPARGPGKLKPAEIAEYKAGRDTALRVLNLEMGGGYSLVEAGDRH